MEAVILIGVPGAGKSTFYRERFASTHVRISLDELKTRARELAKARECIGAGKDLVIDNTNVRRQDRAPWIALARAAGYRVSGYFFRLEMRAAIKRNSLRTGNDVIPVPALIKLWKQMEEPSTVEGFDELWTVTVQKDGSYSLDSPT